MTDKWLPLLNDDGGRLICQSPRRCFSMAQLRQQVNRLQVAIENKGHRNWVLYDENGFRFICALFALLTSGRNVLIPASRNRAAIERLLVSGVGLMGYHPELQQRIDIEVAADDAAEDFTLMPVACSGDWGQVDFCTSGSSGKPKVITKSADQLYLEAENLNRKWQPTRNTLFIPLVTHLHIYGLTFAFLLPLLARAGFYLPGNGGLLGVVEPITLDSGRAPNSQLVVVASPTIGRQAEHIRVLAESGCVVSDDRPAPVSRVFCAGGKLACAHAGQIIDLFDCPVTEIFGSTETGAVATREHNKRSQSKRGNPWRLLTGLNAVAVKDGDRIKSDNDLPGELAVWGGHVGGSRETPVMTGDVVKFAGRHCFDLFGRSNQICKIEGKRVSLHYLVEMLESCAFVLEAAVAPFAKNGREILLCGVVLSRRGESSYRQSGKSATDQSIREHLLQFLDPVLTPRSIRYLDRMPRNEMGKLPQQALIDLLTHPARPTLPLIEEVRDNQDELLFSLSIPMELQFLRGHFENKPIVPGVVLLHWVYHFIAEHWKLSINPAMVNRLKFSKPTAPGDKLTLSIRRIGNGVEFLYESAQKTKFASGQIPLNSETTDV